MANVIVPIRLRFQANAGTTGASISNFDLSDACGIVAATTTTAYAVAQAVKVNRIRLWAPAAYPSATKGASANCSIVFNSNSTNYTSQMEFSDTSVNVSEPAFIDCRPPKRSLAADWIFGHLASIAADQTLFTVVCPEGSILEIDLVFVLCDGNTMSSVTVAGATVGVMYYQPADGDGGVLIPIGKGVGP